MYLLADLVAKNICPNSRSNGYFNELFCILAPIRSCSRNGCWITRRRSQETKPLLCGRQASWAWRRSGTGWPGTCATWAGSPRRRSIKLWRKTRSRRAIDIQISTNHVQDSSEPQCACIYNVIVYCIAFCIVPTIHNHIQYMYLSCIFKQLNKRHLHLSKQPNILQYVSFHINKLYIMVQPLMETQY